MVWKSALVTIFALAAAGCSSSNTSSVPSNPQQSTVTVTFQGTARAGVTIVESTGYVNGTATGVITSAVTNAQGQATLLVPGFGQICFSASIQFPGGPSAASHCAEPIEASVTLALQ